MKKYPYPLTIVMDRYSGVYSGGYFTAWNRYSQDIPSYIDDSDGAAMAFWDNYHKKEEIFEDGYQMVGFGETAEAAIKDLIAKQIHKGVFRGV